MMKEQEKYTLHQTFDADDYYAIKEYFFQGKGKEGGKQVCLAFLILIVCGVVTTFHTYSLLSVIVWILSSIVCMMLYYVYANYEQVIAFFFKHLLEAEMIEEWIFYETFLCAKKKEKMLIVEYRDICGIEKKEHFVVFKTTMQNHHYLFLKTEMEQALHAVLYVEKKKDEEKYE